jgi:hypothetical protein
MRKFVLDFDLARQDCQLARGRRFLDIDAAVNGDARLQVRDIDKHIAQIAPHAFELSRSLFGGPTGPAFQAQKNDRDDDRDDERDQREGERQREFFRTGPRCFVHRNCPKKVPPPTPEGREGRLFPPEQSSKTADVVSEVFRRGNKFLTNPCDGPEYLP